MTPEIQKLINILQTSETLHQLIPSIRRITLLETLYLCPTNENAYNIFLENLSTSPYIPENNKNKLADLVLKNELNLLAILLKCNRRPVENNRLVSFKKMVLSIFVKSKKIKSLDSNKKKYLGACITHSISIEQLKELTINSLETSIIFSNEEKNLVANDVFDNRFDLLLLSNRFDCEEIPRINSQENVTEELDECPICLGNSVASVKLPCQHVFCHECIHKWAQQNSNPECPLCRQLFNTDNIQPL